MSKSNSPRAVPWDFEKELYEKLRDPEYASFYLNEAFFEDDEVVLKTAIGDVVRAYGVVKAAKKAGINRCTVFKTLKPGTRTSFTTIHRLLLACGIKFCTQPLAQMKKGKHKRNNRGGSRSRIQSRGRGSDSSRD